MNSVVTEIDFLPDRYRQRKTQRLSRWWHVGVCAAFVALMAFADYGQRKIRAGVERDLATAAPEYDRCAALATELATLNAELATVDAEASLYAYLDHPWPRSRIVASLLAPLPETISLSELTCAVEGEASAYVVEIPTIEGEAPSTPLSPHAADLAHLRAATDALSTVITLTGEAKDPADVHAYLGLLANDALFIKAELRSLETREDGALLHFTARLVVRPGYGQEGGEESFSSTPAPEVAIALGRNES